MSDDQRFLKRDLVSLTFGGLAGLVFVVCEIDAYLGRSGEREHKVRPVGDLPRSWRWVFEYQNGILVAPHEMRLIWRELEA